MQNKLVVLCQKSWNMSCDKFGGPRDTKKGLKRMHGIRSNAPASHEAKLVYYDRQLQIVLDEMEDIRRGVRPEDIPQVLDVIGLQDEEAELVSNPEVDQGVGDIGIDDIHASPTMDIDPGLHIPTLDVEVGSGVDPGNLGGGVIDAPVVPIATLEGGVGSEVDSDDLSDVLSEGGG